MLRAFQRIPAARSKCPVSVGSARKGAAGSSPMLKSITTIGSAGGNDIAVEARGVAQWHAQIVFDGRDFSLDEVDPVAEIQVNQKRKRRARLTHNDHVTLGECGFVFSMLEEAEGVGKASPQGDVSQASSRGSASSTSSASGCS